MRFADDPAKDMTDIFRRPEFDRSPSWWDRMWSAVGRFFKSLSFSWLGPVGQFVLWLLLIVVVVAVGVFLWRHLRRRGWRWPWRRRKRDETTVVPIEIDSVTDPDQLREERVGFVTDRDYKQAILVRYRELVATLMAARLVPVEPGRTTGELRGDVAATVPAAAGPFAEATDIFEVTWFADHPPTEEEYLRLDLLARTTTAAALGDLTPAGAT